MSTTTTCRCACDCLCMCPVDRPDRGCMTPCSAAIQWERETFTTTTTRDCGDETDTTSQEAGK